MNEYLVAILLEDKDEGDTFIGWPLHVSLVPWFTADEKDTIQTLRSVITKQQPFEMTISQPALMGRQNETPVHLVDEPELPKLHGLLMEALIRINARFFNARYVGSNFRAHVTDKPHLPVQEGDKRLVDRLYIVAGEIGQDHRTRTKEVVAVIGLGHETTA